LSAGDDVATVELTAVTYVQSGVVVLSGEKAETRPSADMT
jgi:hypothetical protein